MLAKIFSAAFLGLDAQLIEVETEAIIGLRQFNIVGLPDQAIDESKERVSLAIKNSGFIAPQKRFKVLVNLAPADLKKEGSLYDLPIALGFLAASRQIRFNPQNRIFIGELGLDGKLKPIRGALAVSMLAKEKEILELILPKENAFEASLTQGPKVIGACSLKEVTDYLLGKIKIEPFLFRTETLFDQIQYPVDFSWIRGQHSAKRALEIAAAGGHHLLMQGPPGAGKSLLAKALPSILPPLSLEEALEVSKIYSICGLLPKERPIINFPPFRSPHHTTSEVALIGGGNPPRPGEITLAHRGVLFLDEFPEFHRDLLESLRQPIEEGKITVLRAKQKLTFPSHFTLVCASNPCPCGYYQHPERECRCLPSQIQKYQRKLSGPLMDRIDLLVEVPQLKFEKLEQKEGESSEQIRERVKKARIFQKQRFKDESKLTNAEMEIPQIKKYCQIDFPSRNLLKKAVDSGKLSARGYHRVLKVARTIADLEESEKILFDHLSEALSYRVK